MNEPKNKIVAFLNRGEENAISQPALSKYLDCSPKTMKKEIRKEQAEGFLICSSLNGYFVPARTSEVEEYVNRMDMQAKARFVTTKGARKFLALDDAAQQEVLKKGVVNLGE